MVDSVKPKTCSMEIVSSLDGFHEAGDIYLSTVRDASGVTEIETEENILNGRQ